MTTYIDKKFINLVSAQLDRFSWKKNDLANCRCPICGDSKKNKAKARGYFFQKGNDFFYKCHNCGAGHSLYRFLEMISPSLMKDYSMERWRSGENGKSNYIQPEESELLGIKSKPKFKPQSKLLENLSRIKDLDKDHPAYKFVKLRKIPEKYYDILYYTDDFGSFQTKLDPGAMALGAEERLVIPFFNNSGDVVAAQGRLLNLKSEFDARNTARYITVKADKSIDRLWYGMWRANPKRRVYVVEGPLDSLFIPNTIAMVGAGAIEKIHPRFDSSDVIYALDNEPRNKQIINYMERLIEKKCNVCIWPENVHQKDVNDMIYTRSYKEIKSMIDQNVYSGLEAKLKLMKWRKI